MLNRNYILITYGGYNYEPSDLDIYYNLSLEEAAKKYIEHENCDEGYGYKSYIFETNYCPKIEAAIEFEREKFRNQKEKEELELKRREEELKENEEKEQLKKLIRKYGALNE